MGISWRGLAVTSAALAMVLLFAGYRQQMRLFVLAVRGNHVRAEVIENRQFLLGVKRIRYEYGSNLPEAKGEAWNLGTVPGTVLITYLWGMSCSESDARWRVWVLPLQIALFLGLSAYYRNRSFASGLRTRPEIT